MFIVKNRFFPVNILRKRQQVYNYAAIAAKSLDWPVFKGMPEFGLEQSAG
jgi:hypothetical protein